MNSQTKKINRYYLGMLAVLAMAAAMLLTGTPTYAATTFTVDSTADTQDLTPGLAGEVITLREAIARANSNNNPTQVDRINFDIPGTGVHTISPSSALPPITEPVVVDGYSQPGSSVNTLARSTNAKLTVQISGTNLDSTGTDGGVTVSASNTVVKGLVINRFVDPAGIEVASENLTEVLRNVKIEGNFVGTDPSGTLNRGNGGAGVDLFVTSDSTVGGTSRASRNLISKNAFGGVFVDGGPSSSLDLAEDNEIKGNLIGTQRDGIRPLGNGAPGVTVEELRDGTANGNTILSNSIFSNEGPGIDLDADGPTANDQGDVDTGPNGFQNKPVISSARKSATGTTTIKGTLNSRPGVTYTVQFFFNPPGTDEGRTFLGQKTGVLLDGSGKGSFNFSPTSKVAAGQTITATATNEFTGDTSEFSAPKGVVAG
jgi:hypothetical protein